MAEDVKEKSFPEDFFAVDKLIDVKIQNGVKLYRVRWKGYKPGGDTYEPIENLVYCHDMIEELEEKIKRRKMRKELKEEEKRKGCKLLPIEDNQYTEISKTTIDEINSTKDTFWRDFDEGKIDVSDQDMYSKVKERACRTVTQGDTLAKNSDSSNETTTFACPKVILKRRTNRRSTSTSLIYKYTIQIKPNKKRKNDILRDYRRRRHKSSKKHSMNENKNLGLQNHNNTNTERNLHQGSFKSRISSSRIEDGSSDITVYPDHLKVLQELPTNDDISSSDFNHQAQTNSSISKTFMFNADRGQPSWEEPSSTPLNCTLKDTSKKEQMETYMSFESISFCDQYVPKITNRAIISNMELKVQLNIVTHSLTEFWRSLKLHESRVLCKVQTMANISVIDKEDVSRQKSFLLDVMLAAFLQNKLELFHKLCTKVHCTNYTREDGSTAMMILSQLGSYDAVKQLLHVNAHKDIQNRYGETALMLACGHKQTKIVKLLLQFGANFAITNNNGINAIQIANCFASKTEILKVLDDYISRLKKEYESRTREICYRLSAKIRYAVFDIVRFSLSEGPEFIINFRHDCQLESPGKRKGFWLCIAHCTIKSNNSIQCSFNGNSSVRSITLNGIRLESIKSIYFEENFIFKIPVLHTGNNQVSITTTWQPQSEVRLVVGAYRVQYCQNSY